MPVPPQGDLPSIIRALETFAFDRADRLPADLVSRLLEKAAELDRLAAEVAGHLPR